MSLTKQLTGLSTILILTTSINASKGLKQQHLVIYYLTQVMDIMLMYKNNYLD